MSTRPNMQADGASDTPAHDRPTEGHAHGAHGAAAPIDETEIADHREDNRVSALEAERTDLKEKLLRTLADMENTRRRAEREATDARIYAVTNFARDMLTVADNIRRALESVPADAAREPGSPLASLIEGIDLTERDLLKSLERHGVKRLEPEGSKFDPNMHQAMFEVPDPNVPTGTVVQVIQTGYAIGERVLRPALVGVAKGGPKEAQKPAGGAEVGGNA